MSTHQSLWQIPQAILSKQQREREKRTELRRRNPRNLSFPGEPKLASLSRTHASSMACLDPLSSAASASISKALASPPPSAAPSAVLGLFAAGSASPASPPRLGFPAASETPFPSPYLATPLILSLRWRCRCREFCRGGANRRAPSRFC